jgi:cytoskeletal protein CcmA (bactofilin family)
MNEPITIIGAETVVSGNLEGDEDLTVEGRVEGSIALSKTLSVEVGGVVRADINVRNAVISGVLVGNIVAQESVHVTEQGRVVGDISSPRVILVDGASFKGNIDMGDFALETEKAEAAAPRRATAPTAAPASTSISRSRSTEAASEPESRSEEAAPSLRRPVPVRSISERTGQDSTSATSSVKRPLPQKARVSRTPPAPKVRTIGKKKAKKKA